MYIYIYTYIYTCVNICVYVLHIYVYIYIFIHTHTHRDLSDYKVLCKGVSKEGGRPHCIAFALECILSGWADGLVRCFDGETGEMLWKIPEVHRGGVTALAVSHNHRYVFMYVYMYV